MSGNTSIITSKPSTKRARTAGTSPLKSSKGKECAIDPPSPTAGPSHHFHQVPDNSAVPLQGFALSPPFGLNSIHSTATQLHIITPPAAPVLSQFNSNACGAVMSLPGIPKHSHNTPNSSTVPDVVMPPTMAGPLQPSLPADASVLPGVTQQQLTDALLPLLTQLLSKLQAPAVNASNPWHATGTALPQTGMFLHPILYLYVHRLYRLLVLYYLPI